MALASYQKITRVIPFKPFGDGSDGAYSSSTIPSLTKDSCSGTATSTTLTTSGSTFANGDLLLLHQTRGTGAGQWEINMVTSGGGSTSLTLQEANHYTFTDSSASQAQVTKILQYTDVTAQSGTWSVNQWAGDTGGLFTHASNGTTAVTGTVSANGTGYQGGASTGNNQGYAGEGAGGVGAQTARTANGNGGGAGGDWGTGGGGGFGATGEDGQNGASFGYGGSTDGDAELTDFPLGGGGGAGSYNDTSGAGADGGGGIFLFTKDIVVSGAITTNGNTAPSVAVSGGGGAGGGIIIQCQTATLGTNKLTATGGPESGASNKGGYGGVGRIAVHHSGTITGTTNPTFSNTTDSSLVEPITYSKNTSTTGNSLTTYYCGQNYDNTAPGTPGGVNRGFNS